MKRREKWIVFAIVALVSLILTGVMGLYALANVTRYSVYYAKHTPQADGTNPVVMKLMEDMVWRPYTDFPDDDSYYYPDSSAILVKDKVKSLHLTGVVVGDKEVIGLELSSDFHQHTDYYFDNKGRFLYFEDFRDNRDSSPQREQEAEALLRDITDPLVAAIPEPTINLQWLFDYLNKGKFD